MLLIAEILSGMGYCKSDIEESLKSQKYDDIFATYLLLGRRSSDVSDLLLLSTFQLTEFDFHSPLSSKNSMEFYYLVTYPLL